MAFDVKSDALCVPETRRDICATGSTLKTWNMSKFNPAPNIEMDRKKQATRACDNKHVSGA